MIKRIGEEWKENIQDCKFRKISQLHQVTFLRKYNVKVFNLPKYNYKDFYKINF